MLVHQLYLRLSRAQASCHLASIIEEASVNISTVTESVGVLLKDGVEGNGLGSTQSLSL